MLFVEIEQRYDYVLILVKKIFKQLITSACIIGLLFYPSRFSDDEDDESTHKIRLSKDNRRHNPEWYGRRILKLGKQGKVSPLSNLNINIIRLYFL